jgi:hypothetical protein
LNGGVRSAWIARDDGGERREVCGRERDVAQLIAERVVRLRHRIQSVDLGRRDQVDCAQPGDGGGDDRFQAFLQIAFLQIAFLQIVGGGGGWRAEAHQ